MSSNRGFDFVVRALAVFIIGGVALALVAVVAGSLRKPPAKATATPSGPTSSSDPVPRRRAIGDYQPQHLATPGAHPYCTFSELGGRDRSKGRVTMYIWSACETFDPVEGGLAIKSVGRQLTPAVLQLVPDTDVYKVVSHTTPAKATYEADVRRLFPASLLGQILGPGAITSFPPELRIRALEGIRLPLHQYPDVEFPPSPKFESKVTGDTGDLHFELEATPLTGKTRCLTFTSTAAGSTPEDKNSMLDEACGRLTDPVALVSQAIVVDARYAWAIGLADTAADEVELTYIDGTTDTVKVTDGVWAANFPSLKVIKSLAAKANGTAIGGCGGEATPGC